jgi:hypothetical protein
MDIPTLKEFLALPIERVRPIVPATVIFAAGGTRRSAALSGISPDEYPFWAFQQLLRMCQMFCSYGVKHLILPIGHPGMFKEEGHFGSNFVNWIEDGLSKPQTLEYYRQANWKDHIVIATSHTTKDPQVQRLQMLARSREQAVSQTDTHLWYFIVPDYDDYWQWVAEKLATTKDLTRQYVIQALYGANIPPTDLLVSFGKPTVSLDILPPFLWDLIQGYWTQQPSYLLDDPALRRIFYDYAFQRNTYRTDKTGREREALNRPTLWKKGPTIGLGVHIGPYWYPEPFSLPLNDDTTE